MFFCCRLCSTDDHIAPYRISFLSLNQKSTQFNIIKNVIYVVALVFLDTQTDFVFLGKQNVVTHIVCVLKSGVRMIYTLCPVLS